MRTSSAIPNVQSGAALAAVLILITAGMVLAASAMRSATTEAQLSGTLIAAREAFWLAELGVASAMLYARSRPADLPLSGSIDLGMESSIGRERVEIAVHTAGTDTYCAPPISASATRRHYKILATGFADHGATSTNVQGFYICTEHCTVVGCDVTEHPPVKSYWKTIAGGLP